jgi:hypothetical protein
MDTDKIYAEAIVNEYSKKETSKVMALKKLDNKVKLFPRIFTYTFGVISSLVLGVGMCLAMRVIGEGEIMFVLGIIIGLIGIVGVSINYPIYKKILNFRKEKYAFDIIELAKEITDKNE